MLMSLIWAKFKCELGTLGLSSGKPGRVEELGLWEVKGKVPS